MLSLLLPLYLFFSLSLYLSVSLSLSLFSLGLQPFKACTRPRLHLIGYRPLLILHALLSWSSVGLPAWPLFVFGEVLESLGHAETRQNPTSSRFGKFLRLQIGRQAMNTPIEIKMITVGYFPVLLGFGVIPLAWQLLVAIADFLLRQGRPVSEDNYIPVGSQPHGFELLKFSHLLRAAGWRTAYGPGRKRFDDACCALDFPDNVSERTPLLQPCEGRAVDSRNSTCVPDWALSIWGRPCKVSTLHGPVVSWWFNNFMKVLLSGDLEKWDLLDVAIQQQNSLERFKHGHAELAEAMKRLSLGHFFQPMLKARWQYSTLHGNSAILHCR